MIQHQLIDLPKITDPRGNLTFVENGQVLPFNIKRCYYLYDVPGGEERGGHAFKVGEELIVAISGSFDVIVSDGDMEEKITLNRSYKGLYVPKLHWRKLTNFSTNSLALIVASTRFNALDYIYAIDELKTIRNEYGL